jgi:transcriptional regulator of acetoin/glycerol metabolism
MIRRALESERGRVARAAEALGISRSSLYEKIRRYGIVVSKN